MFSQETKRTTLIAVPIGAVLAFAVASYVNLSNQSAVAINVAKQHGAELELLRKDYTQLHGEIAYMTTLLQDKMSDRFRGADAKAMEDRLMSHIERIEKRLDRSNI